MGKTKPVVSLDDVPMWDSIEAGAMKLQCCDACGTFRYPPAPICAKCLSLDATWTPVSGRGTVVSWVVFHRQYFEDFPAPFNATAVRLEEGPIVVTNLIGPEPEGSWIGRAVALEYVDHAGRRQHAARVVAEDSAG